MTLNSYIYVDLKCKYFFNLHDMNMSLTSGTIIKYTEILVTINLILEHTSITFKSMFLLMNFRLHI